MQCPCTQRVCSLKLQGWSLGNESLAHTEQQQQMIHQLQHQQPQQQHQQLQLQQQNLQIVRKPSSGDQLVQVHHASAFAVCASVCLPPCLCLIAW